MLYYQSSRLGSKGDGREEQEREEEQQEKNFHAGDFTGVMNANVSSSFNFMRRALAFSVKVKKVRVYPAGSHNKQQS